MIRSIAALLLLLLPSLVWAQGTDDESPAEAETGPARKGVYVQVGGLVAIPSFDSHITNGAGGPDFDPASAGGVDLVGGYRTHERWATEFQFTYVPGFEDTQLITTGGIRADTMQVENLVFSINEKYFLMTDELQPYLKAGVGGLVGNLDGITGNSRGSRSGGALRFGLGADYYLGDHVLVYAEGGYVLPLSEQIGSFGFGSLSIGLGARF